MSLQELVGWQNGKHYYLITAGLFLFIFALFTAWMARYISSDIYVHYQHIRAITLLEKAPPANFLYYLTVVGLVLFQPERLMIAGAIALTLTVSVVVKFGFAYHFLNPKEREEKWGNELLIAGIAIALLFAFSLPGPESFLLGKLPANLWHNSTLIFLMPFALALFFRSYRYVETGDQHLLLGISVWVVLNVLAKPSFFMCFAVVFPLLMLLRHGWGKNWLRSLIPVMVGGVLLALEYYLIYVFVPQAAGESATAIEIRPFHVWNYKAKGLILWSWFASVAFPVCCLLAFPNWLKKPMMQYVLLLTGVGYLIYILLVEAGDREFHGNFNWQLVVCHFIWFLVSIRELLQEIRQKSRSRFVFLGLGFVFSMHVLSGIAYLVTVFQVGTAYV